MGVFYASGCSGTAVSAQDRQSAETTRIKKLEESLLSPCCYGEPVSRHMSQVAFEMRKEITERVQAGQSDREILDHYKQLYGEQVLVEPDGQTRVVLYSLPVLISLAGCAVVLFFLKHALSRRLPATHPASPKPNADPKMVEKIRNATDDF
jgi:cytochrome c-type biogenesis protein CcmH